MPKFQPVNILGGCYADSDRAWSLQDTVNWLPEQAEQSETRTPTQFKTPPGLKPFLQVSGADAGKPVRGTYNCENKLFAAIGKTLYQVTNSGVAIPQGTIPGNTRVTMTHNQISQGNQLVAVNGSSGYVFNTLTQVYEKIVDEGFPGAIWVGFADGYILGIEPGRRFAFSSEPADALNYNTLDRFTSEYKPDLIVTGIINHNELILLNETSYEFFENTGATQQPFRSKRIYGDVGCASRYGACNLDRTVFMFGTDGKFYRLEGYNWIRISTRPIEQAIRGLNWAQCFTTVWEDGGHSVVRWTFPDGMTWCFDQSTQLWHRMKSLGLDRYRINSSTQLGQDWYCGDFQAGRIWRMDWDYILEGNDEIESERVTGVLSDNQNLAIVNRLELLFATGQQLTVPVPFPEQPDPPTITGEAPDGVLGEAYAGFAYTLTGDGPLEVELRSGILPPDLDISLAGVINTDETTLVGSYTFTLRVTDRHGLWAEHTDTIQVTCIPGTVGLAITDTLTIPDAFQSAYIYPLVSGNLGVAYAADGVSVGGFYHLREYDSDLVQVGSTVDVEWMAGGIGDSRLWLRGVNEDGLGVSADDNSGECELIETGVYQANFRPSYCNYNGWWYNEAGWSPEFGGLVWFGKDSDDVEFLYLGVRKTGSNNPGNVPGFIENTLLKFPLAGSAPIAQTEFVTGVGTVTSPRFWMNRARNGNIYVITLDGNLQTYDDDLTLLSSVVLTTPITGSGNNLRGFGVDGDVIAMVYNDGGGAGQGRVDFRNVLTETLIQSIPSADMAGDQATRVLFSDTSCYIQCRNWVGRIEFTPPTCVLP